jgi:PAS domain S-box-containing protein
MPQKRNIQSSEPSAPAFGYNNPKKYSIWQNDNRKIWFALVLLIAGLVLTCAAALYVKRGVESIARKEFDFACDEIKDKISTRIQQHAQILRSASAFFEVNGNITREQWHSAIARQNIEQVLPGIQGIGYAIIIPPEQLALHERKIRNEGFPQYTVKPIGKRDIYTSIIYLEPFSERNLRAFGYDMFSEPVRRKAMVHARDFDEASLSGKVTLVQETDKDIQTGTLMYVPVYESRLPVRTVEERRRAIRGWVYSPYRMNDLMRGILGTWESGEGKQIRLEVFDGTSFQSEALLYDSRPGQRRELASSTIFDEQTSIPFKNHHWSLRFSQVGDLAGIVDYSKAWYVLIGGTLVNVLLFTLYFLLINASNRAQTLAEALSRELRESTERKRAEEALRESLDRSQAILASLDDAVFLVDPATRLLIECNDAATRIFGYSHEEMVGRGADFLHVDQTHFEQFCRLSLTALEDPGYYATEFKMRRKDGGVFPTEHFVRPVHEPDGRILYVVSVVRDITERKQAERKLRQQADAMEASADGIAILNEDQNYVYVNEAHARIYGYGTSEELIGKPWTVLYDEDELQRFSHEIMPEFIRKGQWSGEATGKKKDGSVFPQEVSLTGLDNGGLICVVRDITSRKLAEEELQHTMEKLRKSLAGTIQVVSTTVETRDPYTAGHQRRVSNLARTIAQEMRLPSDTVNNIRMAGIIHDIGKISVPAETLSKPGKLRDMEFSLIKVHPQAGYDILKDVGLPYPVAGTVLQHHERLDGSGYPRGLKGEQILLEAQIIGVADVVEAILSHRPYRKALGIDAALDEIEKNKGILYNEKVVEACVRLFRKGFKFESTES